MVSKKMDPAKNAVEQEIEKELAAIKAKELPIKGGVFSEV